MTEELQMQFVQLLFSNPHLQITYAEIADCEHYRHAGPVQCSALGLLACWMGKEPHAITGIDTWELGDDEGTFEEIGIKVLVGHYCFPNILLKVEDL